MEFETLNTRRRVSAAAVLAQRISGDGPDENVPHDNGRAIGHPVGRERIVTDVPWVHTGPWSGDSAGGKAVVSGRAAVVVERDWIVAKVAWLHRHGAAHRKWMIEDCSWPRPPQQLTGACRPRR